MSIDESMSTQLPIRCFLSYARADDEEYEFIHALKTTLEHNCFSQCGRKLEVFLDRESIGWGDDWRDRIADSLNNATVFIPVVSLQFFAREACRAELQAFHAAAKNLGVTELLLPLVAFGKDRITSESDDALIRMVEKLQHLDIQDAVISGPKTREWRTTMLDIAARLVAAVEGAEKIIQDRGAASLVDIAQNGSVSSAGEDNHLGLYELNLRVQAGISSFETSANEAVGSLGNLLTVFQGSTQRLNNAPRDVTTAVAAEVARDIEEVTINIQRAGGQMETTISAVDADLRQYHALIMEFGSDDMKQTMKRDLDGLEKQFSEIQNVMDVMADFVKQIQPVEVLSAPLRKALRPLRLGVNSIQVAVATMESWTKLGQ
ncbi:toll/interleukin-1 receptor domain-containing protein [Actinophytocola oryzae]|uniref:TIR domain-containing protein n=1 Tax=Actinophytocola oryzae TaxID=502181 RepID=A0A4R7VRN4_9PSEU|nr:toll/interleukin-1 receptor domain-containing protein [Actinophytocola oryzae]TDV52470.1 TIR domain-containing protein [Actinophytocola oryzae]